ncbi:MAG TPA: GatB/YqeY domain-containing protein [Candidatus Saccharimonadales bacterium]
MLEQRLEQDIKAALLAGDSVKATTLRGLKATLLNVKVAEGTRDQAMSDDQVIAIFSKEAKKRQESADLYVQGNNPTMAEAELAEKAIIETYLPEQLDEAAITTVIDETIAELGVGGVQAMGQVIGAVKAKTAGAADGGVIARLVKERLSQ